MHQIKREKKANALENLVFQFQSKRYVKSLAGLNRIDIYLIMHKHWTASLIPYPHFSRTHPGALWKSTACSVSIHHERELVYLCEDEAERTTVKKKSKDDIRFMRPVGP